MGYELCRPTGEVQTCASFNYEFEATGFAVVAVVSHKNKPQIFTNLST